MNLLLDTHVFIWWTISPNRLSEKASEMNIEQTVIEKLRQLPLEKQQEILDFAEFLSQKIATKPKLQSIKGLCADLAVDITVEEIDRAREEIWGNFPREN